MKKYPTGENKILKWIKYKIAYFLNEHYPFKFCWVDLICWAEWGAPFRGTWGCNKCDYCGKVSYYEARKT